MYTIKPTDKLGIIGLGYVGLPLATAFGKIHPTIGFDIRPERITQLKNGIERTLEVTADELSESHLVSFTENAHDLADCKVFIVTVPTPINQFRQPDLEPLIQASKTIGKVMQKDCVVIYESTVFPGATEEVCVPLLEQESGLVFNRDFFAGYSPERINTGDKTHRIENIVKVTSGSTDAVAQAVDELYQRIVTAGTHKTSSIKVAEAAKVIENTQRDLNIALVNELAMIFNKLHIDTEEVLEAAGTKWNFMSFRPGLVGGHCIGVDPYYLTHKAQQIGHHPQIILSGRRINDQMGAYIADQVIKMMTKQRIHVVNSKILIMGLTFKENCPDLRNTRVIDIIQTLKSFHASVDVFDPWANPEEAHQEYGLTLTSQPEDNQYDAVILAVSHREFLEMGSDAIRKLGKAKHVLYDIKSQLPKTEVDGRL